MVDEVPAQHHDGQVANRHARCTGVNTNVESARLIDVINISKRRWLINPRQVNSSAKVICPPLLLFLMLMYCYLF